MSENEYITQAEARAMIRVSKSTWYRMVKRGMVRPVRVTERIVLVERGQVEKLLQGRGK